MSEILTLQLVALHLLTALVIFAGLLALTLGNGHEIEGRDLVLCLVFSAAPLMNLIFVFGILICFINLPCGVRNDRA